MLFHKLTKRNWIESGTIYLHTVAKVFIDYITKRHGINWDRRPTS
jgi:hypothetical protein